MSNPFLRRATEYIRDDSAFLAIVSPEPLRAFVARHEKRDTLFDLPARIIGSPGSGKTMMATLSEFRLVEAILRDQASENNRVLAGALASAGLLANGKPLIAAVRVPMESEYRDYWELPYDAAVKTKLVLSLVQARAVLGLIRNLTASGRRKVEDLTFVAREGADATLAQIGGVDGTAIRNRAREVEAAIYNVGSGLIAPRLEDVPRAARDAYQPFEVLREVAIDWAGERLSVKPLVILDDAHTLHPEQFEALFRALTKREIKIGRWMMMRMDTLSPSSVFQSTADDVLPGLQRDRDFVDVFMQAAGDRANERKRFRKMATDMADRYLKLVEPLKERNFSQFSSLLSTEAPTLTAGQIADLRKSVDAEQFRLKIAPARREKIDRIVSDYAKGSTSHDVGEDVRLAMTRILFHRYINRLEHQSGALFEEDREPKTPLKADAGVAAGARVQLHEKFGRPLHYGIEDVCDASNENAELFLHLAGALVARMETRAIRNLDPALPPNQQQQALTEKAEEIIRSWSFPFARPIKRLIDVMAPLCLKDSLEPNARLGAGANAFGVPEEEMQALLASDDEFASVLKYAVSYGALVAVREYGQGGKLWCLLELSGPVCLAHGLTFNRGGFIESSVVEIKSFLKE
jgi:hypothetical protein